MKIPPASSMSRRYLRLHFVNHLRQIHSLKLVIVTVKDTIFACHLFSKYGIQNIGRKLTDMNYTFILNSRTGFCLPCLIYKTVKSHFHDFLAPDRHHR
jgi:hypothetical protein